MLSERYQPQIMSHLNDASEQESLKRYYKVLDLKRGSRPHVTHLQLGMGPEGVKVTGNKRYRV